MLEKIDVYMTENKRFLAICILALGFYWTNFSDLRADTGDKTAFPSEFLGEEVFDDA